MRWGGKLVAACIQEIPSCCLDKLQVQWCVVGDRGIACVLAITLWSLCCQGKYCSTDGEDGRWWVVIRQWIQSLTTSPWSHLITLHSLLSGHNITDEICDLVLQWLCMVLFDFYRPHYVAVPTQQYPMPDKVRQVVQSTELSLAIGGKDRSRLLSYQSTIALCMPLLGSVA